jgi:hypothetical protein
MYPENPHEETAAEDLFDTTALLNSAGLDWKVM